MKIISLPLEVPNIAISNKLFELTQDYKTSWISKGVRYQILIPKGFVWDGASVPRALWSVLGFYPGGIMLPPSVVHDFIYIAKGNVFNLATNESVHISRKECDLLFKHHMEYVGMPKRKLNLAYKGVRWFGWTYWMRRKK